MRRQFADLVKDRGGLEGEIVDGEAVGNWSRLELSHDVDSALKLIDLDRSRIADLVELPTHQR